MRNSIKDGGLLNSIAVRPTSEPGIYEIIDGYYRYTCCKELNWTHMPCIIKQMTDEQVLASQVRANAIRPETTPIEFAAQLKRLQKAYPEITASDLSRMVGKSVLWIKSQLSLLDLIPEAQKAIERDEMPMLNGYRLAKVPQLVQAELLQTAKTMDPKEFYALTTAIVRSVQESVKNGKLENWFIREFKPQPFLKPLKTVLAELENLAAGTRTVTEKNLRTPIEGWKAALNWAASLDDESVEKQRRNAARRLKNHVIERTQYFNELDEQEPDPFS
jgi:ParB/RepB/Spo0J family partition protein